MKIAWTGPFKIQTYLDNAVSRDEAWTARWPRERDAVYLVSEREWNDQPDEAAHILYVGGNTGESSRFVTRIGDLLADLFGFFGQETGHHSGGQTLWHWCYHHGVRPTQLWLAWGTSECARCAERHLYSHLPRAPKGAFDAKGLRNKVSPPACPSHG
jgi:hypothetical protein